MFVDEMVFEVPFHDIDIMEVAWHGHYLKYFELARTRLMRGLGLDWTDLRGMGYAMPVTKVQIKFKDSLRYGEQYRVRATIEEFEHPALMVHYEILSMDRKKTMARGSTQQIYYSIESKRSLFELPLLVDERFREKLSARGPGGTFPLPQGKIL